MVVSRSLPLAHSYNASPRHMRTHAQRIHHDRSSAATGTLVPTAHSEYGG
jgi:hypothetical protein